MSLMQSVNVLQSIASESVNYCEAASDRVSLKLFDRVYPLDARPATVTHKTVPMPFRKLASDIAKELPLNKPLPRNAPNGRDAMYRAFHASCEQLKAMYAEMAEFMAQIYKCNVDVRTDWMENRRKHELMQKKAKEWEKKMPQMEFTSPNVIRIELNQQAEFVIRARLTNALATACEEFVLAIVDWLDLMVDMEQVGLIHWNGDNACRFYFFRHKLLESTKDVRQLTHESSDIVTRDNGETVRDTKKIRRTERDVEHLHRHVRETHELLEATNYELGKKDIPKPKRVEELLASYPKWLQPLGRVVTGQEVYRIIVEQDVRTDHLTEVEDKIIDRQESVVYQPDPAVTLGQYVLTGWGPEELQQ